MNTDSETGDTNETRNFSHYRNTVFIPWIESLREHYAGYVPGMPGIPVPEELTCCSWCDGGGPQLKNIVSPEQMEIDKKHRIISNKHARASTAVQQGCDTCPVFNVLNLLSKSSTAEHLPMNGYKLVVKKAMNLAKEKGKFMYVVFNKAEKNIVLGSILYCMRHIVRTKSTDEVYTVCGMFGRSLLHTVS